MSLVAPQCSGWLRAVLAAALFPSAALGAANVLIVSDPGTSSLASGLQARLQARQLAAGNTVTALSISALPSSLLAYDQVWDLSFVEPLSSAHASLYSSYLATGRTAVLMGENVLAWLPRNNSIASFLGSLGAGTVTVNTSGMAASPQTLLPQFRLANTVSNVPFPGAGKFTAVGRGSCMTSDCTAAAWGVGSLPNAPLGTLVSVLDVNYLLPSTEQPAFTDNLIAYLTQQRQIALSTDIDTQAAFYLASQLGITVNPVFRGGVLLVDGSPMAIGRNFLIHGGGGTISAPGRQALFSGVFSDAQPGVAGRLTLDGQGAHITLSAAQAFSGALQVRQGVTLVLSASASLAASSGLQLDGSLDLAALTGGSSTLRTLTGSGQVLLGDRQLLISQASGEFAGSLSGSGGLQLLGGSWTLSGSPAHSGATQVAAGASLALKGGASLASSSGLQLDGSLDLGALTGGSSTLRTLTGSGQVLLGDRQLLLSQASGEFAGSLSGSGGLQLQAGSWALSGSPAHSGATQVAAGASLALKGGASLASSSGLQLDGSLDLGALTAGSSTLRTLTGSGQVLLGDRQLLISQASGEFAGSLSGSGGLQLQAGSWALSGSPNHSGATQVTAGASLALKGGASLASSSGLQLDGSLDLSALTGSSSTLRTLTGSGQVLLGDRQLLISQASGEFAGGLSGSGGLQLLGGSWTLSGSPAHSGATQVAAGASLALKGGASLASSSGLQLDGSLDLGALTGGSSTLRTLTGSGQVLLGDRQLLISQASGEFTGSLSGSGGVQLLGGSWTLSGDARHSGASEIAGGATLRLDGSLASALHVSSGGSLTGRGLLQGPVSLSPGARLAPGNSPGVLRATQAISLAPGARLEMDLNGPTPGDGAGFHDQLRLSGAAGRFAPQGATLSLRLNDIEGLPAHAALYQPRPGERLRLVSAEGGLDGSRFARLERPAGLAPGSRLRLRYDDLAGWIDLQVLHSSFLPLADKLNAQASAQALEQLLALESAGQPLTASGTQLLDAVQALPAAGVPARLLALSGELHAALAAAQGLQAEDAVLSLSRRLSPGPWSAPRLEPWVELQAAETRWREDAVASGIVASRQQLILGMDLLQAPSWRLGLAGSYASTQLSVQALAGGRARLQQGLGLVYGAWTSGPWQLDLMGGLGRGQQRSERAEPLGDVSVQGLRSELSTRNRLLAAGLSHHLGEQALGRISPFLRLSWQQGRRAAGAEAPGAQAAAQRLQALAVQGGRAEFGLQLDSANPDPWRSAQTYQARLGLGRDYGALLQPVIQAELAGAALAVRSPQLGTRFAQASLAGTWRLSARSYAQASLGGQWHRGRQDVRASLGFCIAL